MLSWTPEDVGEAIDVKLRAERRLRRTIAQHVVLAAAVVVAILTWAVL